MSVSANWKKIWIVQSKPGVSRRLCASVLFSLRTLTLGLIASNNCGLVLNRCRPLSTVDIPLTEQSFLSPVCPVINSGWSPEGNVDKLPDVGTSEHSLLLSWIKRIMSSAEREILIVLGADGTRIWKTKQIQNKYVKNITLKYYENLIIIPALLTNKVIGSAKVTSQWFHADCNEGFWRQQNSSTRSPPIGGARQNASPLNFTISADWISYIQCH